MEYVRVEDSTSKSHARPGEVRWLLCVGRKDGDERRP